MNIRECYDTIGADFEDVLGRLGSESLIQRFALKFIDDGSWLYGAHPRNYCTHRLSV